jgi:cation diffusion facilitator CzcD-associated flavoprotein CzcO
VYSGEEEEVELSIFEKADRVGGLWNIRPSAIYPHLRTNAPAPIIELEGGGQQAEDEHTSFLRCQVKRIP